MLQQVPPEEHIHVDSYSELCKDIPNVYYMSTEEVYNFIVRCDAGEVGPCILVSGFCDYSIREQDKHHPNADLLVHASFLDYEDMAKSRDHYNSVRIGPTCNAERCHPGHKYAVRTDRFTWFTLRDIPKNILRWYTTNLDVLHPRMKWLPFGLNNDGPGSSLLPQFVGREKKGLLYVNFSANTAERVRLKQYFKRQPWVTYRDDANLPVEQYLAEVAEHKYVLSPYGCGLDAYRNYEAMYLGTIPILPETEFSKFMIYENLPLVAVKGGDMYGLTHDLLNRSYDSIVGVNYDYQPIMKSHYRNLFENASQLVVDARLKRYDKSNQGA